MRTGGRMYRNTGRETFTLPVNCEQAAALDGRKDFSFGCFVLFFFGLVCDNRTPDTRQCFTRLPFITVLSF